MRQSFNKTIRGHELEFNRLLYPVRYKIVAKGLDSMGMSVIAEKDELGNWNIDESEKVPYWVAEIRSDIEDTIAENEELATA